MLQSFFQAASKQHADALVTGGMLPHGCTTNVVRIEVDSASMYQHGKTEEALGHRSNGMAAALSGASSKLAGTGRCLNLPAHPDAPWLVLGASLSLSVLRDL